MPLIVLMPDALGWISSAILMATLSRQIYKQWQIGSSEGVPSISGTWSDGTRHDTSPSTPMGSLLVVKIDSEGQLRSS